MRNESYIANSFYENIWNLSKTLFEKNKSEDSLSLEKKIDLALSRRSNEHGLTIEDSAILLETLRRNSSLDAKEKILNSARNLRSKLFENKVATMVPIEISSYCASNCRFCGWSKDNKEMLRLKISSEALIQQTRYLAKLGFSHFEISSGDDLNYIKNELSGSIKDVKETASAIIPEARVSICLTPLLEPHYQSLKSIGLDTVLTWQETYSEDLFYSHVSSGPKAHGILMDFTVDPKKNGYIARMKSHEYAVRSGLQVGLGVMIGLSADPEIDILSVILHAQELIKNYRSVINPIIIGMPTWNSITTSNTDNLVQHRQPLNIEDNFELISAIYLLALPDYFAWVFPNCRVSKKTQLKSIISAGCFTSTMVRVGPGAYLDLLNEKAIESAFIKSSKNKKKLDQENILKAEQFIHHFDSHEKYLEEFIANDIRVSTDQSILEKFKRETNVDRLC